MPEGDVEHGNVRRRGPRPGGKAGDPAYLRAKGSYAKHPNRDPERGKKPEKTRGKRKYRLYVDIARRYADDVVAGKIAAGKYVRLACKRHLDDLARVKEPGYPFEFVNLRAADVCYRIETFPHIKGKWAREKELIVLQPWQCFAVCVAFGWVRKATKLRRFREVYWRIPRKNTKSTMAAAIGNAVLLEDGDAGAEIYSGATTEKQAWEVFGPARLMLERSKDICAEFGVEVWAKAIICPEDNSSFKPVIGKPGDGASPTMAIVDEYHEHDTSDLLDTMVTGMGSREQPMVLIITTAGTNLASPCYDKDKEAQKVLEGVVQNDELFAVMYGLDEGDDWSDPDMIVKANPNLGVSVDHEFLIAQQRTAIANPAYQNRFRTKHLNEWCGASVSAINMHTWRASADTSLKLADFEGAECWQSLDLASKLDIAAYVKLFVRMIGDVKHYYVFGRFYLPEDTIEESRANGHVYRKWVIEGKLIATEGAEIEFDVIREDVKADAAKYQVVEVVYDPWRATQLAQQIRLDGATTVEIGQTYHHMPLAFDELLSALKGGRFHHDGDPVLEWMASNVVARDAKKGLLMPGKEKNKPDEKIDGIVAIIMAMSRAMQGAPRGSMAGWLAAGPVLV